MACTRPPVRARLGPSARGPQMRAFAPSGESAGRRFYACASRDERGGRQMERPLDAGRLGDHIDRLYRAAWALCGSREDAEDLVQETFVRVLARPRVLRGEDELYYLMRVLRNTFLTGLRSA